MHWTRDCASVSFEHHWPAPVMRVVGGKMKLITKMSILRALASAMILALMLVSYVIGYRNGSAARGRVVFLRPDVADIPFVERRQSGTGYDPHLNHVNTVPSRTR